MKQQCFTTSIATKYFDHTKIPRQQIMEQRSHLLIKSIDIKKGLQTIFTY
jgi:hypothetical protein